MKNQYGCGSGSRHENIMKEHCRKTCGLCDMLVMVTGGKGLGERSLDSVELLNINGSRSCSLPSLPKPRSGHSQSGSVVCGGWRKGIRTSCVTLSSEWKKTHNLAEKRVYHSAWSSPRGIMLLGGDYVKARTTTEILTENGDTIPGFTLDYETR